MSSTLTIEQVAQKLKNPITGKPLCNRTIRNYIDSGLLDAERDVNPKTRRVTWLVTPGSIKTLDKRLKQRDEAMRKQYAERLKQNKEIGKKRDEENPQRKEKRLEAIRAKRTKKTDE